MKRRSRSFCRQILEGQFKSAIATLVENTAVTGRWIEARTWNYDHTAAGLLSGVTWGNA